MSAEVLEGLCAARRATWLRVGPGLRVEGAGGLTELVGSVAPGDDLIDVLPELVGLEPDLEAVRCGQAPRLDLGWINREADGGIHYLDVLVVPDSGALTCLVTDATEHGLLQQRLAQSRNEIALAQRSLSRTHDSLRALLDAQQVGTAVVDGDGRVLFLSEAGRRLLGCADLAGGTWSDLPGLTEADVSRIRAQLDREPEDRERLRLDGVGAQARRFELELDVVDDPVAGGRWLLFLYDVAEVADLRRLLAEVPRFQQIIGEGPRMAELFDELRNVAAFDTTVLVTGETGTGKELVARAIHDCSARHDGPFIAMNCAGLSDSLLESQLFGHKRGAFTGATEDQKGYFESADGGTLFLDEIGDIPMSVQTRLLRVLQEREVTRVGESRPRPVDVRFVAATHQDLDALVSAGRFRADLMYRIRVARLALPPLRERTEDIPLLVQAFTEELRERTGKPVNGVEGDALRRLVAHPWPGNVRELRGVVEAGFVRTRGSAIQVGDLPPELRPEQSLPPMASPEDERDRIQRALESAGGNRTRAAQLMGVSRATFYRRLTALGLDED